MPGVGRSLGGHMSRSRLILLVTCIVVTSLLPLAGGNAASASGGAHTCALDGAGLDIIDGAGTVERESMLDLPNGTRLDLDGTLRFVMLLADASCPRASYALDVYGTSVVPLAGPHLELRGSETQSGDGATNLSFAVTYRDYAALRDPVDFDGSDRCVSVVGTATYRGVVVDRAPDLGTFTVCPGGAVVTQRPFS